MTALVLLRFVYLHVAIAHARAVRATPWSVKVCLRGGRLLFTPILLTGLLLASGRTP